MSVQNGNALPIHIFPDGRMATDSAVIYIGTEEKTLANWRSRGVGPPFCKLGGRVFYFKTDVDNWIAERSGLVSSAQARTKEAMRKGGSNGTDENKHTHIDNLGHPSGLLDA